MRTRPTKASARRAMLATIRLHKSEAKRLGISLDEYQAAFSPPETESDADFQIREQLKVALGAYFDDDLWADFERKCDVEIEQLVAFDGVFPLKQTGYIAHKRLDLWRRGYWQALCRAESERFNLQSGHRYYLRRLAEDILDVWQPSLPTERTQRLLVWFVDKTPKEPEILDVRIATRRRRWRERKAGKIVSGFSKYRIKNGKAYLGRKRCNAQLTGRIIKWHEQEKWRRRVKRIESRYEKRGESGATTVKRGRGKTQFVSSSAASTAKKKKFLRRGKT